MGSRLSLFDHFSMGSSLKISASDFLDSEIHGHSTHQKSPEMEPAQFEPISASYTPGSQHIYFSCKTADCKAVFAQSPNNYPITVFVVQGIERGLPAVDWVKFLWLASHPSEKIHNDEGVPGQVLMYGSHRTPVCPSVREHWTRKLSMDHVPLNL